MTKMTKPEIAIIVAASIFEFFDSSMSGFDNTSIEIEVEEPATPGDSRLKSNVDVPDEPGTICTTILCVPPTGMSATSEP